MDKIAKKAPSVQTLVLGAILTAVVVVFQLLGSFIHLGPFSISLVLVPIVVGAAKCGPKISAWLGFVFSVVVLLTDAAAFLAVSVWGTIATVLVKGTACGLVAGLIYQVFVKKNEYLGVMTAAIVCPLVNTGIFLLGCVLFFLETVTEWGLALGFPNAFEYMIFGMAGGNFLVELLINIILCPIIVRILNLNKK